MARLIAEIEADQSDSLGGWAPYYTTQARWDPARSREWHCWAEIGNSPVTTVYCEIEVAADDPLGLCTWHRRALLGLQ